MKWIDLFHSGFRPGYGTEMAVVTMVGMCQEMDWKSATLLIFLVFLVAFETINQPLIMMLSKGTNGIGPGRHCSVAVLVLL